MSKIICANKNSSSKKSNKKFIMLSNSSSEKKNPRHKKNSSLIYQLGKITNYYLDNDERTWQFMVWNWFGLIYVLVQVICRNILNPIYSSAGKWFPQKQHHIIFFLMKSIFFIFHFLSICFPKKKVASSKWYFPCF